MAAFRKKSCLGFDIIVVGAGDGVVPAVDVGVKLIHFFLEQGQGVAAKGQVDRRFVGVTELDDCLGRLDGAAGLFVVDFGGKAAHLADALGIVVDDTGAGEQRAGVEEVGAEEAGFDGGGVDTQGG